MTDNAKALADHIRSDLTYITGLADHMEAGGDVSKKNIGDLIAIVRWNAEHHLECRDTIETQAREIERLRWVLVDVTASLVAAISLLERGGKAVKKTALSDLIFNQMVRDYTASVERARTALGYSHDQ